MTVLSVSDVVNQVDVERIYQHVLRLEGTRHPTASPEGLNEAANYVLSEFRKYGIAVNEQKFTVPGSDGTFRNIEGSFKNEDGPELLIVSHYDTVENCPGANDNASAVAVMLEAARVLSEQENTRSIRFVSFTLEELNPVLLSRTRAAGQRLGLFDTQNRCTSLQSAKIMGKLWRLYANYWAVGNAPAEALSKARIELEPEMNEAMILYVKEVETMYERITATSWPGKMGAMGSSFWVEEATKANRKVLGTLCLETIGYTSSQKYSQHFPAGMSGNSLKKLLMLKKMNIPYFVLKPFLPQGFKPEMLQAYGADDPNIGNFLLIVGDANSRKLTESFLNQCRLSAVDLPCVSFQLPLGYEQIAGAMSFFLRSDHAPFWRQGIPALFLTDTADYRYPYYHTPADTINRLDFGFMEKICKATTACAINLTAS